MKRNIFFLLSICMLLFSCSDGNDPVKEVEKPPVETKDPFITLKKSNIDFTNEGGSESILIESNVAWTTKSSAGWCTVTPSSGNKSTTSITLSAPANEDYDTRSCTVTIESGAITKTITVNQGENLGLLITQDRYELGNEESTIAVEVKANVEFEVEINNEWITKVETRGLTTSEMEFKIAKNDTYDNRDGSITIKQKGGNTNLQETVSIKQAANRGLIVSPDKYELSNDGGTIEVEVKANVEFDVEISDSWISQVKTRGLTATKLQFQVAKNQDYDNREGSITIKQKGGNLSSTIKVYQSQKDAIILSDKTFDLSQEKQAIQVELKTNVEFEVIIPEAAKSWVSYTPTRGLRTETLTLNIAENKDYTARSTEVYVKNKKTNLQDILTINQSAYIPLPSVTTSNVKDITQTTAVSGGNISDDGGALITVRGVCWSTSKTPTISDSKTEDGTGSGSFISNITGLVTGTTYYVRAYATNSNGTSYGKTNSFKTLSIPILTTTKVLEITNTTAVSGGNISDDGGAAVTARGVCWSTNDTPSIDDNKTENGKGIWSFTSNIINLVSNTTYYVRAYATNSEGTGYGSVMSFTTQEGIDIPSLTSSEVTRIEATKAVSGGNISDEGGALVTARGVCWSTSKTPTISDTKTEDGTGTGSFISNISDLEPSTTYHVRAYATNSKGTGYGTTYSFKTDEDHTFTDSRDGNVYKGVTIGNQVWMAENLKYLPPVVGSGNGSSITPYHSVYGYNGTDVNAAKATANYSTYGVLYNWFAAMAGSTSSTANPSGVQGVCPAGWHLPSSAEWTQLTDYLGGYEAAGGKLKETGTAHWRSPNIGATNESGFTALPGGNLYLNGSAFSGIGNRGYWWSASQDGTRIALGRSVGYDNSNLTGYCSYKEVRFSVRCVRD